MYFIYTLILALGLDPDLSLLSPSVSKILARLLPDRFGFLKIPQLHRSIWVHAVSVGEVKAVKNCSSGCGEQFPGKAARRLDSDAGRASNSRGAAAISSITRFTFRSICRGVFGATVDRVDPEMVIIAETEIWPNFPAGMPEARIRVVMINGRISDRSFARYRLVRRWLRRVFEDYTVIGMQSEMDRQRIEAIGANPQQGHGIRQPEI